MVLEPFKDGNGCCDNNCIPVKCSKCSQVVGTEYSDCTNYKHVEVPIKNVLRLYK